MKSQRVITVYHDAIGDLKPSYLDHVTSQFDETGWRIVSVNTATFIKAPQKDNLQTPVIAYTLLIEKV